MYMYRIELFKLLRKKDVYWVLIFTLFPLLYGILLYFNSPIVVLKGANDEAFMASGAEMAHILWSLGGITGIPYILFAIMGANSLSRELETGQMNMILTRTTKRDKVILSKFFALSTIVFLYSIVYYIINVINYHVFFDLTKYSANVFFSDVFEISLISILLNNLEYILYITIALFIGIFLNNYQTFFVSIAMMIPFKLLDYIDNLKFMSPSYIKEIDRFKNLSLLDLTLKTISSVGIMVLYISILLIITIYKFKRIDVKY